MPLQIHALDGVFEVSRCHKLNEVPRSSGLLLRVGAHIITTVD